MSRIIGNNKSLELRQNRKPHRACALCYDEIVVGDLYIHHIDWFHANSADFDVIPLNKSAHWECWTHLSPRNCVCENGHVLDGGECDPYIRPLDGHKQTKWHDCVNCYVPVFRERGHASSERK